MSERLKLIYPEEVTPEMLSQAESFLTENSRKTIRKLLEFDPEKNTVWVGSHQTSIERFFLMIASGRILPSKADHEGLAKTWGTERSFAFLPNMDVVLALRPDLAVYFDFEDYGKSWQDDHFQPVTYGLSQAAEDSLEITFKRNLPHMDVYSTESGSQIDRHSLIQLLSQLELPKGNINPILSKALERKGVVIYLSPKVFEFNVQNSKEFPEMELVVVNPNGFPIDCLAGVKPLGLEEEKIFQEVVNNIKT